jgi:hypothetical protein
MGFDALEVLADVAAAVEDRSLAIGSLPERADS